jgi:hypothetical protein
LQGLPLFFFLKRARRRTNPMRTPLFARTTSRVLGNGQDSRFVATRSGHAIALAHSISAWRLYAGHAAWHVAARERVTKQACLAAVARLKRLMARWVSPVVVVDRDADRPALRASVGRV